MSPHERIPDAEELNLIRDFSVDGLAWSVTENKVTLDNAVEIIEEWFLGDSLAVEMLYKAICRRRDARD